MKKLLLAITTVAAFTGSAFAADMAVKAPPMAPPPPPPPTFTGCWLSGGVGYGLFDQENTSFDTFDFFGTGGAQLTGTETTGGKGWLGRVGGGCDYQFGFAGNSQWVIGGFADYDWTNIRGQLNDTVVGITSLSGGFGAVGDENMRNQWAIGGRIGWVPLPGLLTFVSAGYTQAQFDATSFNANAAPFIGVPLLIGRDAATYHGWFVGGGEEYAFTWLPVPGLFWKTEYRLSEFDRQSLVVRDLVDGDPLFTTQSKKWVQTVTTSLVWRFNFGGWGGPTRY